MTCSTWEWRSRQKGQVGLTLKGGWAVGREGKVWLDGCAPKEGVFARNWSSDGEICGGRRCEIGAVERCRRWLLSIRVSLRGPV